MNVEHRLEIQRIAHERFQGLKGVTISHSAREERRAAFLAASQVLVLDDIRTSIQQLEDAVRAHQQT